MNNSVHKNSHRRVIHGSRAIHEGFKKVEGSEGTFKIGTRQDGAWVEIWISDTGVGIPNPHHYRSSF